MIKKERTKKKTKKLKKKKAMQRVTKIFVYVDTVNMH